MQPLNPCISLPEITSTIVYYRKIGKRQKGMGAWHAIKKKDFVASTLIPIHQNNYQTLDNSQSKSKCFNKSGQQKLFFFSFKKRYKKLEYNQDLSRFQNFCLLHKSLKRRKKFTEHGVLASPQFTQGPPDQKATHFRTRNNSFHWFSFR